MADKKFPTPNEVDAWMDALKERAKGYKDDEADKCYAHIMQTLPFQNYEITETMVRQIVGEVLKQRFPNLEPRNLPVRPPETRDLIRLRNMGFKI